MACSATALALTPLALASRMPRAFRASRENWSVPALIDWMKRSRGAFSTSSFFHSPDTTSTSAFPILASISAAERASLNLRPVPRALNGSGNW